MDDGLAFMSVNGIDYWSTLRFKTEKTIRLLRDLNKENLILELRQGNIFWIKKPALVGGVTITDRNCSVKSYIR